MFGLAYVKVPPTTYIAHFVNGEKKRSGVGLSFWYLRFNSEIVRIPLTSVDVPYAFTEMSADYQEVTVQGELTYRITDPERVAQFLDFSIDTRDRYRADDPMKLNERLVHPAQALTRSFTHLRKLNELLLSSADLAEHIIKGLQSSESIKALGVEIMAFNVLSLKPSPDMSKAIQAEAREDMLRKADEAIYARRNASVELERKIKENELNTEIAVAQKKRDVHETEMAGEIAVEQQRTDLVEHQVANARKEADARNDSIKALVAALRDADWRTLTAISGVDSRSQIALAFREMAERSEKIGNLNIAPELLTTLLANVEQARPVDVSGEKANRKTEDRRR